MAEALWQELAQGTWQSASAGSKPAGYVHPLAIRAMAEIDLDIAGNDSKHLDRFQDQEFDLVVTVCDSARETCPVLTSARQVYHWPFDDPADAEGNEAEQLKVFRRVRDEIRTRIAAYLAE
jgi:arsenate reductase